MKKKIIILLLVIMMPVMLLWASGTRTTKPTEQALKNTAKSSGGIVNNSASIIIQDGAYVVISGQGNYVSQGSGTTSGSGTLDLTGNLVNNNNSGNPLSDEGTVTFSGQTAQSISGNPIVLGNVLVNNPEGISFDCEAEIEGDLVIAEGTVNTTGESIFWLTNKDIAIGGESALSALNVTLSPEPGTYGSNSSINKKWNITGLSSGDVQIILRWTDSENNDHTFGSGEAMVWTHNETGWILIGSYPITIDGLYNTVSFFRSFDVKNDLGDYTITGDGQTLPVVLSHFSATLTAEHFVNLIWVVESETDHAGYNILRNEVNDAETAYSVNFGLIDHGSSEGSQISYSFLDTEIQPNSRYYYWLESVSLSGQLAHYGPMSIETGGNGDNNNPVIPIETKLMGAFPNPFNPVTTISYSLKEANPIRIDIYNLKGQFIRGFRQNHSQPGYYTLTWDGKNDNGQDQGSGIYLYRFTAGKHTETKKVSLLK